MSSNSEPQKKKGGSKRRRRRDGKSSSSSSSEGGGAGLSAGVAKYDASLEELIVDERKSTLPRLEDLKRGKKMAQEAQASGTELKSGGPGILLPRELEELKQKERAKEQATKGAPPYFDIMTKITWGAIAFMVAAEVIVQSPLVRK